MNVIAKQISSWAALATFLVVGLAMPDVAQAKQANCNSATSSTARLWKKYAGVAKGLGCGISTAVSTGAVDTVQCLQAANKIDKSVQDMISFWNKNIGKDGKKNLGPRTLKMGETKTGKVISTFGRVFISPTPVASPKVRIRLKKTAGRAKTNVAICKVAPNGKTTQLRTFTIGNGKKNIGKVWEKEIAGVQGHLITVHLDAASATNSMSYELKANEIK